MLTRPAPRPAAAAPGGAYPWPVPTVYPWLRGHPTVVDGALAAVLFLVSIPQWPGRDSGYVALASAVAINRCKRSGAYVCNPEPLIGEAL